jgi:hypothetical protein
MRKCCGECKDWLDGRCGIYRAARYREALKVNSLEGHLSSVQAEKFIDSFYCSEFKGIKP